MLVPTQAADLPLDAALLVCTLDSGLAIEGFDAVVGTDGGPPVGLDPLAGEPDHARDGGLEVVVADLPGRHPAEHVEGVDVTLEEGFLPSRGTDPVHGLARVGEPKAEQRAGYELAAQADGDVAEVNLGLAAREVLLRDERVGRFPSDLDANLTASGGDVLAGHPVRHHPGPVMFVKQSSITTRYASIREPRLGGCFLSFGHADSSAAVTVRKPTPCLRCSARLDIPDRASRRIAAYRSTRERGCVIGGTPDVSTPWARLSAPGHRPGTVTACDHSPESLALPRCLVMCCAGGRWAVLRRPGVRGTTDDGADEPRVGQVESH